MQSTLNFCSLKWIRWPNTLTEAIKSVVRKSRKNVINRKKQYLDNSSTERRYPAIKDDSQRSC